MRRVFRRGGLAQSASVHISLSSSQAHSKPPCVSGACQRLPVNGSALNICHSGLLTPCCLRWQSRRPRLEGGTKMEGARVPKSFLGMFHDLPWTCDSESECVWFPVAEILDFSVPEISPSAGLSGPQLIIAADVSQSWSQVCTAQRVSPADGRSYPGQGAALCSH